MSLKTDKNTKQIEEAGFDPYLHRQVQTNPDAEQVTRNRLSGSLLQSLLGQVDVNIVPDTSGVFDLGSASRLWNKVYTEDLRIANLSNGVLRVDANGDVSADADLEDVRSADNGVDGSIKFNINNTGITGNDGTTTNLNLAKFDSSGNAAYGSTSQDGDTLLEAGSTGIVKIRTYVRDNGSGSYTSNYAILFGWDWEEQTVSGQNVLSKLVSFGLTFSDADEVFRFCSYIGTKQSAGDPTSKTDIDNIQTGGSEAQISNPRVPTTNGTNHTTQMYLTLKNTDPQSVPTGDINQNDYFFWDWMAAGRIT